MTGGRCLEIGYHKILKILVQFGYFEFLWAFRHFTIFHHYYFSWEFIKWERIPMDGAAESVLLGVYPLATEWVAERWRK
jgi:hypothetical protein